MDMILKALDAVANIATVLAFLLALVEGYKRYRMTRKK